jgi:hypothetical protein
MQNIHGGIQSLEALSSLIGIMTADHPATRGWMFLAMVIYFDRTVSVNLGDPVNINPQMYVFYTNTPSMMISADILAEFLYYRYSTFHVENAALSKRVRLYRKRNISFGEGGSTIFQVTASKNRNVRYLNMRQLQWSTDCHMKAAWKEPFRIPQAQGIRSILLRSIKLF